MRSSRGHLGTMAAGPLLSGCQRRRGKLRNEMKKITSYLLKQMFCLPNSPDKHEGQDQIIPSSRRASGPRGWMVLKASVAKWIVTTSQTQSSLNLLFSSVNVIHFVKDADPKQQRASLALSAVCLTTVPTCDKREICPEELKRIRQLPMETTELCVAA